MIRRSIALILAVGVILVSGAVRSEEEAVEPAPEMEGDALIQALRQGGFVIVLRHASTQHEQEDVEPIDLEDCSKQRNLSEKGKEEAAALGKAVAALGVPIGEVLSSPYCRCVDTARLAFGRVEKLTDLRYSLGLEPKEKDRLAQALRRMLSTAPAAGKNTILASHTSNLKEAAGVWPKTEGDMAIFRPDGNGGFRFVGRMSLEQWKAAVSSQ